MQRWIGWLVAIATVSPAIARAQPVEIRGNVALPDEAYRTVLELAGTSTQARGKRTAESVGGVIRRFLLGSGYDLATVSARRDGERIVVDVDEGRLDKVIFVDQGALRAIELRFALELPGHVFNRPMLERRLAELKTEYGAERTRYEVVAASQAASRLEIDDPGLLGSLRLIRPGEPHELRVFLEYPDEATGVELGAALNGLDGIVVLAVDRFGGLLLDHDRLVLGARLGVSPFQLTNENVKRSALTRAGLSLEWYTPPIIGEWFRTFFSAEGDLFGRERPDLGIEQYFYNPVRVSLNADLALGDHLHLAIGGGAEQRNLFGLKSSAVLPAELTRAAVEHLRAYGRARATLTFNPSELRKDRRDRVTVEGRYYAEGTDNSSRILAAEGEIDWATTFSWDELRFAAHGELIGPSTPFYQQISLSDGFLRLAFASVYAEKVASLSAEYRLSLSRDIVKISAFNDAAVLAELPPNQDQLRFIESFGVGFHLLLIDTFQLSAYAGAGFSSRSNAADFGFLMTVDQVF